MKKHTFSRKTRDAIAKYGEEACRKAFMMHSEWGYGASGVAQECEISIRTTQQADAAINAGREMAEFYKKLTRFRKLDAITLRQANYPGYSMWLNNELTGWCFRINERISFCGLYSGEYHYHSN